MSIIPATVRKKLLLKNAYIKMRHILYPPRIPSAHSQ